MRAAVLFGRRGRIRITGKRKSARRTVRTMEIFAADESCVNVCADIYVRAFRAEPWNEEYETDAVRAYLNEYLLGENLFFLALRENGEVRAFSLGVKLPAVDGPYLRVEEFCVSPDAQRRGLGAYLMDGVCAEARKRGCDGVLLGTQKDVPAYGFYLKNGFVEIDKAALLYRAVSGDTEKE